MADAPEQHPDIPAGAVWRPDVEKWEVSPAGAATPEGDVLQYRPDGTLYMRARFAAGVQDGPFSVFHPDGALARQGRYEQGRPAGVITAYAGQGESAEPLRSCCVPESARQMLTEYENGELTISRFLDGEGRVLLGDGSLRPDPPPGLPAHADYDESTQRWLVGPPGGYSVPGLWRAYSQDGRLEEEIGYEEGWKTLSRLFAADGLVKEESAFSRSGRRHGAHRRRFVEGAQSPYRDERIAEERGAFDEDHPVGPWQLLDSAGAVVREVNRGRQLTAEDLAGPAFADEDRPGEAWEELGDRLVAEGLARAALCAAARAAACRGEVDGLIAFLARHTVARVPDGAAALAQTAADAEGDAAVPALLSALIDGAEPAATLQSLSGQLRGTPRAARDLVEAALLLAPERRAAYFTRGLVRLELGDARGAVADAGRVAADAPEAAQFLRDYVRLLCPEWAFWPARESLAPPEPEAAAAVGPALGVVESEDDAVQGDDDEDDGAQGQGEDGGGAAAEGEDALPLELPEAPLQPLAAIRRTIQVYATRLLRLREAARLRIAPRSPPAWLPPDLSAALLPEGPLELRHYTDSITDETDEGTETVEVEIDETLAPNGAGLPALMRAARAQWAALTWLCWCAGLERVGLPETLAPPSAFPLAAGATIARFFRAQDVIATGGLRAQTAGVPSFAWEGFDVDQAPRPFVEIAVDELFELRALFLWLMSPENLSPFQNDLRQV